MGPDGSLCLQSPLLFSKARRGHKFEHEDSAQIALTLASEGNQGQESEEELGCPPPGVQIPIIYPPQGTYCTSRPHSWLGTQRKKTR